MKLTLIVLLAAGVASGCVMVPEKGQPIDRAEGVVKRTTSGLLAQVAFDHPCPPGRILWIRGDTQPPATADLDVCGAVRRYKRLGPFDMETWVDVTTLYPPSSLPEPISRPAAPAKP